MKKSLLFAGLATALTLASCAKNEVETPVTEGKTVSIYVVSDETKTENDGLTTKWVENDELSVFVASAGTTEYGDNLKFTVNDVTTGQAQGTATLEEGESYDWYLFYPYSSYIKTPATTSSGYMPVGQTATGNQVQSEYGSKAHLAGGNFPLYGIEKNVAAEDVPSVTMHQIASVVAIKVKNTTSAPVLITGATFTAPTDIVGTYYIDFASGTLSFTGSGASYVSNTATLNVSSPTDLAAGETAVLYVGIRPFSAGAGSTLSLTVKGSNGNVTKNVALSDAVAFESGHIKTLNINYDKEASATSSSWVRKSISEVSSGSRIVIAGHNGTSFFAVTNDNGTSSAPGASAVSITAENKLAAAPDDNIIWDFVKDASGNMTFYVSGDNTKWLYCTNANNGVRVGNNDNKLFIYKDYYLFHTGTSRYVGIYNAQDWRCYTSINNNIKDQVFYFFVEETGTPAVTKTPLDAPQNVMADVSPTAANAIDVVWDAVTGAASYIVTAAPASGTPVVAEGITDVQYTFTNLEYDTEYDITVVAYPADATVNTSSEPSAVVSVTTGAAPATTGAEFVDILTADLFAATNTSYKDFSGVSYTGTDHSSAVYAGNTAKTSDAAIQMRSNNNNSGIVSTTSGGSVTKVVVSWNSATVDSRSVQVYGKSTAYSSASELYDSDKQGTLLGTMANGTTTLTISGDYAYIGIRSASGALYLDKIEITWVD